MNTNPLLAKEIKTFRAGFYRDEKKGGSVNIGQLTPAANNTGMANSKQSKK